MDVIFNLLFWSPQTPNLKKATPCRTPESQDSCLHPRTQLNFSADSANPQWPAAYPHQLSPLGYGLLDSPRAKVSLHGMHRIDMPSPRPIMYPPSEPSTMAAVPQINTPSQNGSGTGAGTEAWHLNLSPAISKPLMTSKASSPPPPASTSIRMTSRPPDEIKTKAKDEQFAVKYVYVAPDLLIPLESFWGPTGFVAERIADIHGVAESVVHLRPVKEFPSLEGVRYFS